MIENLEDLPAGTQVMVKSFLATPVGEGKAWAEAIVTGRRRRGRFQVNVRDPLMAPEDAWSMFWVWPEEVWPFDIEKVMTRNQAVNLWQLTTSQEGGECVTRPRFAFEGITQALQTFRVPISQGVE